MPKKKSKKKPGHVRASHILVPKLSLAQEIKKQLLSGSGVSFEKLAQKYSECPSRKRGGDLGFFRRGQMVKEFEQAVYSMKIGEISDPVKTQHGYHIIKRTA